MQKQDEVADITAADITAVDIMEVITVDTGEVDIMVDTGVADITADTGEDIITTAGVMAHTLGVDTTDLITEIAHSAHQEHVQGAWEPHVGATKSKKVWANQSADFRGKQHENRIIVVK